MANARSKKHKTNKKCSRSTPPRTKHTGETCVECPSTCCHDLAMPINKPRTRFDIDELKWQLHYDTIHVAIRHHRWYLVVRGRCIYLDRNNMCKIYERRSQRCRNHKPPDCERFGLWYETLITTPEELEGYLHETR